MCYANATAALVSMLNFIIFFFLYKKGPAKSSTQRNFDKAMRTAKKAQQNARKDYWQQNSGNTQGNGGQPLYGDKSKDSQAQQSQAQHAKRACRSTDVQYAEGQNLTTKTSHSDSAQNASATTNTVPTIYIPTSM